jgi:hypothetical protein
MKGILCVSLLILLMPSVACAAALPGDSADGKRLHDANCMGCHDTGIYTRKDRLVGSLDALQKRLGDCSHMAKKEFVGPGLGIYRTFSEQHHAADSHAANGRAY